MATNMKFVAIGTCSSFIFGSDVSTMRGSAVAMAIQLKFNGQ